MSASVTRQELSLSARGACMLPQFNRYNTHTDFFAPGQSGKTSAVIWAGRKRILSNRQMIRQAWKADLYQADVAYCAFANPTYKVRLLDPSGGTGYNPFKLSGDLSTHVENLAKSIVENVSGDSTRDVPSYTEAAEPFFAYLALSGETPFSARRFFSDPKAWLTASLTVPEPYKSHCHRIARLSAREFEQQTGTLRRRLRPFINSAALMNFTSSKNGVNVSELLKDGYSIFFNGAPSAFLSFEAARIINGLFLSDLMRYGIENATTRRSILAFVDEIQEFAPTDFASSIDTVLGSGLKFVLIHHHADQFSERLKSSVDTNARTKILGGGLSYDVRKQYAELAYARQINKDMHRQPQISHITEYFDEEVQSMTEGEFGDSLTTSSRLHPESQEVQTGWDDYSREQKVSFYAERFLVPDRTFTAILPDGTVCRFKVPTLGRYLYDSAEVVKFMDKQPKHEPAQDSTEGSDHVPGNSRSRTKKPPTLHNAG